MSEPVELLPREFASSRKPVRRSFGAFFGALIAKMLTTALALVIFAGMIAIAIYAKGLANQFIYGETPKAAVAPGNYQWTPDKGLQKIN